MAAPISHIVLAQKIYKNHFSNLNSTDFFIGTLFPDIRYLGCINRNETHYLNVDLLALKKETAFEAGLKFHSYIDLTRQKFLDDKKLSSYCPKIKYLEQSIKFYEDILFYDYVMNWQLYINNLNEVNLNELKFNINKDTILKWHQSLQNYFNEKPNKDSIKNFIISIGFSEEVSNEIVANIKILNKIDEIKPILNLLYENFS